MLDGLITIIGGLLAASALIIARKPNAQQLIDKLTPYQGWIGVGMFGWGVWETVMLVSHLSALIHMPLWLAMWLAVAVADLAVGFLLGFGLITKYTLRGNATAIARGQAIRTRLAPYQGLFGVLAMGTGTLFIVLRIVHA